MKKIMGILMGVILMLTGASTEVWAKNLINSNYDSTFLVTEIRLSSLIANEYFAVRLNDADYGYNTISFYAYRGASESAPEIVGVANVPIRLWSDTVLNKQTATMLKPMGHGNDMGLITVKFLAESGWTPRNNYMSLDLRECLAYFEEGVICKLDREEGGVFYYEAYVGSVKVRNTVKEEDPIVEDDGGDEEANPGDGGDSGGGDTGLGDGEDGSESEGGEPEGGSAGGGNVSENKTTGNGGSASKEVDAGRESVLNMLADNNAIKKVGLGVSAVGLGDDKAELFNGAVKGDKDGTDIEIPPVGVADEDGVGLGGWAWLLWVAILALGAWMFLLAYKRRKNKENDRAVAKIVAGTKK